MFFVDVTIRGNILCTNRLFNTVEKLRGTYRDTLIWTSDTENLFHEVSLQYIQPFIIMLLGPSVGKWNRIILSSQQ